MLFTILGAGLTTGAAVITGGIGATTGAVAVPQSVSNLKVAGRFPSFSVANGGIESKLLFLDNDYLVVIYPNITGCLTAKIGVLLPTGGATFPGNSFPLPSCDGSIYFHQGTFSTSSLPLLPLSPFFSLPFLTVMITHVFCYSSCVQHHVHACD